MFWSYAHDDDSAEGGRIAALAGHLRDEIGLLTGEQTKLFLDRETLQWGDDWREGIKNALYESTFFVPVITPRYLASPACRDEFLAFRAEAEALGVNRLILPIKYVGSPILDAGVDSTDDVAKIAAGLQWRDFSEVRLMEAASAGYRAVVHEMAERLVSFRSELAEGTVAAPRAADIAIVADFARTETSDSEQSDEDDAPGLVDLMVQIEVTFPEATATLQEIDKEIRNLGTIAEAGAADFAESDAREKGFVGRLAVIRRLAKEYEAPSIRLEELAAEFGGQIIRLDPAVHFVLDYLDANPDQLRESTKFVEGIRDLSENAIPALDQMEMLAGTVHGVSGQGRDLRPSMRRIEAALRFIADARAAFAGWGQGASELLETLADASSKESSSEDD